MNHIWGHFKTITTHKWIVMKLCFRCGLYKQGLLHDLSKYSWIEFSTGVKYYQGDRSPNAVEKEEKGYSEAWLHHAGRNKHHFNYWMDISKGKVFPIQMPVRYVVEMFCDRIAATKTYQKQAYSDHSPLQYFRNTYDYVFMHQQTKDLLQLMLEHLSTHGLDQSMVFVKTVVLKKGYALLTKEA